MSEVPPVSSNAPAEPAAQPGSWPTPALLLFRLLLPYLAFSGSYWIFQFADESTALIARPYEALWGAVARWVAVHGFHWSSAIEPNFVRDTRFLYALLTCFFAVSVAIALAWSLLDRKRREYTALHHWLRVFVRYVLAYLLLHYGMDKVFLLQFPAPSLARLTERFGDYSPSSLMWAFIGSSTAYTLFGGLAEILGAVLLLTRRTATLGALISFAVMFNVTVMDFSYDVAVKLLCLHILLMALFLAAPDAQRLVHFFFLNRATQPAQLSPPRMRTSARIGTRCLKIGVILYLFISLTVRDWKSYRQSGAGAPRPPLYGLYEVQEFRLAGIEHPPLLTDRARWRDVIFETPGTLTVRRMDDSLAEYPMHLDPAKGEIRIDAPGDPADRSVLKFSQPASGPLQLDGSLGGVPMSASLNPVDRSSFTLVSRGFHWISESGFIR